jgi:hypothetical protein
MTIATSLPPKESSPCVLPGRMLSERDFNGFHVAWILLLVVTTQPGPSSHQVFIAGMHLKQRAGYHLISDAHGKARTIRGGIIAWHWGNHSDLREAHIARAGAVNDERVTSACFVQRNEKAPLLVAQQHKHKI